VVDVVVGIGPEVVIGIRPVNVIEQVNEVLLILTKEFPSVAPPDDV
jgi:hypothetical protein